MKNILLLLLTIGTLASSSLNYAQSTKKKVAIEVAEVFYPLKVQNDLMMSKNVEHTYFIFMGKTMDTAANVGGLKFQYDASRNAQVGTLEILKAGSKASDYMFQLDTMQGYDKVNHTITLMIPYMQSGRAMISVNYPLVIGINDTNSVYTFVPPNVNNPGDPNYNIIFDKFEFTFTNAISDATPYGTFYINPTAVDFFGLPIRLESSLKNSGAPAGIKRPQLLDTIKTTISKNDLTPTKEWSKLLISDPVTGTILRVACPVLAPGFDSTYLKSATLGFNYNNDVIAYYKSNSVTIDCTQLDTTGFEVFDKYRKTPKQDPGAYFFTGKIDQTGQFTFNNTPLSKDTLWKTIDMAAATSDDYFGPGKAPFDTPNKMVKSILVETLTSAFTVGLLPAPGGDTLNSAYFHKHQANYYSNNPLLSKASKKKGPWYDLYAKAIHATGAVIYAFAFDDVLAQDGTISSAKLKDTITIHLGQIGAVDIPNPADAYVVQSVVIDSIIPFTCVDTMCTVKVYWTVPPRQSALAKYFLMISAGDGAFSINPDSIVKMQLNSLIPYDQNSASLTLNKKYLGFDPKALSMQVFTCGADTCAYPTAKNIKNWTCAVGCDPFPKPNPPAPLLPVTITSITPFTADGDNYKMTVNWTVPPLQSKNAHYYIMLQAGAGKNGGFSIPADSIIALQLDNLAGYNATSASLTLNKKWLGSKPQLIGASVFTCGDPQCACPTKNNFKSTTCAPGSAPMFPHE